MNPVSGSMLSTMAIDSSRMPAPRSFAPPPCIPFSMAIPMPTSSAPACFTMSMSAAVASPVARKSSMMMTLSCAFR